MDLYTLLGVGEDRTGGRGGAGESRAPLLYGRSSGGHTKTLVA
jgi:hypothetical protein